MLNPLQFLRRIAQRPNGWSKAIDIQTNQLPIIKKLYAKYGLELRLTGNACPEQYKVFKDGKQVAYYRLRDGEFKVHYPDYLGENIYTPYVLGDGIFNDDERIIILYKAMQIILLKINKPT